MTATAFDIEAVAPDLASRKQGQWAYHDPDGEVVAYVVRLATDDGGKDFRPFTRKGDGWERKAPPSPRPLYNLPALSQRTTAPVLLCEGEKAADAAKKIFPDFVVTTSMGGSNGATKADWSVLRGREVVIWPDHDEPGAKYSESAAGHLAEVGASEVRIVAVDERFPPKWDLANTLPNGVKDTDLYAMVTAANRVQTAVERGEEQPERSWPAPLREEAFHGLLGRIVRTIEPHTEADPVAILLQLIVYVVNVVGRSPHWIVEGTAHFLNLFLLLVGPTGAGRKGTSIDRVTRLLAPIDPFWRENCMASGLSSGEGLVYRVRDGNAPLQSDDDSSDPGITDKRLVVEETEFANVFQVNRREGNTLSTHLRNAWDGKPLSTMTKKAPLRATNTHISVIGHITETELAKCLGETDATNGFLNRFLIAAVRRSKSLPFGGSLKDSDLKPLVDELGTAITCARTLGEMGFTPGAADAWARVYEKLTDRPPSLFGSITARAAPIVRRLACAYAMLDLAKDVDEKHLYAALAVWQYCEDSCRYLFGDRLGDATADKILDALKASPAGLSRSGIVHDVLQGNVRKEKVDAALGLLARFGFATRQGSHPEQWYARDKEPPSVRRTTFTTETNRSQGGT